MVPEVEAEPGGPHRPEARADLVHRLYISNGYLDAQVEKPIYHYSEDGARVDATIPITEGRQYTFGQVAFSGQTIYGSEALHGQLSDLLEQPYTDNRVSDIPRRLQSYYRTRGYYEVKVDATGNPEAATNGRLGVQMFGSMQLGGEKEAIEQAQIGAIQFARVSVGALGPVIDDLNVFNLRAYTAPIPAVIVWFAWWRNEPLLLALGLVWLAHIGMDRVLGYGLKYNDSFKHTHLGQIGRSG